MRQAVLIGSAIVLLAGGLTACAGPRTPAGTGAAPPAWPDSRWRVVAVAQADGSMATVPAAIRVDLAFDATAARATGSAGCNRWTAGTTIEGGRIAFGPAAASKRMCFDPEGVMDVEAAFLGALARVAQARIDDERLRLTAADGAPLLDLVRATGD